MTTRRRRAGSESYAEELLVPTTSSVESGLQRQQLNSLQPLSAVSPQVTTAVNNGVLWGAPSLNVSGDHAYYKKTDTYKPSSVVQSVLEIQNSVYTPHVNGSYQGTLTDGENNIPSGNIRVNNQNLQLNCFSDNLNSKSNSLSLWPSVSNIEDSEMASRDRTQEFVRIVRSQQGNQTNNFLLQSNKSSSDLVSYSEFMKTAKSIGGDISSTYAKLEKLTHLAKNRSLFDDSHDRDIQDLTRIIRHDLTKLTGQLTDLRNKSCAARPNGTSSHLQKHSSNLVGTLQTKVALITQNFKNVLEVRTKNLLKQAERRDHFTGGAVSGELPPGAVSGHHHGSVLVADETTALSSNMDSSRSNGEVSINLGGTYHQQLTLMGEQDTLIQARTDTMRTIESTIVELGTMFKNLATMVKEQEELVHRIDANVEDAELNVEAAHSELLKYFKSVSSNRMLMIKVFGIMIVFFVIFVVFMA